MKKNVQLDWLYCFLAKIDDLGDNCKMDLPVLHGLWSYKAVYFGWL